MTQTAITPDLLALPRKSAGLPNIIGLTREAMRAPPCVRTSRRSSHSRFRSLRMVCTETEKRADSASTVTSPPSRALARMAC